MLYLKLFLVSELLWMIHSTYTLLPSTLAAYKETKLVFTIIDCVYALQGVYIFIVMVLARRHVKKNLGGMRWCCCSMPQKWSEVDDAADVEPFNNNAGQSSVGLSIYYA